MCLEVSFFPFTFPKLSDYVIYITKMKIGHSQFCQFIEIPLVTCEAVLWRVQRVGGSRLCFLPFSVMVEDPGGSSTTDCRQVLQSYLEWREAAVRPGALIEGGPFSGFIWSFLYSLYCHSSFLHSSLVCSNGFNLYPFTCVFSVQPVAWLLNISHILSFSQHPLLKPT